MAISIAISAMCRVCQMNVKIEPICQPVQKPKSTNAKSPQSPYYYFRLIFKKTWKTFSFSIKKNVILQPQL